MGITQDRIRPVELKDQVHLAHAATVAPTPSATMNRTGASRATVLPPPAESVDASAARYEAVRSLGAGGMGEVALVRDNDIGRTVALKRPIQALDGEGLDRFAREVRTVGRLEHPGIAPIHDVGIDEEGRHFFVMKYVEGETLSTVIQRLAARDPVYLAKYTVEHRTQIFMQLCQTLKYAHNEGVLHRDLKPDNVMVGPFGEVMLMDWGISRRLKDAPAHTTSNPELPVDASKTCEGSLVGTPAYMSPEQARGEINALDERSDLYSLCALFYELVTLRHYLAGKRSSVELITSIGHDPDRGRTEWLGELGALGVPAELIHFLRKGMSKSPADRFQTVGEMLAELDAIRDGRVYIHCHLTFMKRFIGAADHAVDRHPAIATLLLAGGTFGALFGLVRGAMMLLHG